MIGIIIGLICVAVMLIAVFYAIMNLGEHLHKVHQTLIAIRGLMEDL